MCKHHITTVLWSHHSRCGKARFGRASAPELPSAGRRVPAPRLLHAKSKAWHAAHIIAAPCAASPLRLPKICT